MVKPENYMCIYFKDMKLDIFEDFLGVLFVIIIMIG